MKKKVIYNSEPHGFGFVSVLFRLFQFVSVFDSLLVMIWFSFGFVSVVSVIDFHLVLISFEFGFSFVFLIK